MIPLVVNYSDSGGGAARAATRLVTALRADGVDCEMLSSLRSTDLSWVIGRSGFSQAVRVRARSYLGNMLANRQPANDTELRSLNRLPSRLDRDINQLRHDVVNLHWIGAEQLSIEAIGRIRKPIVWTMHDMWPFAGAEHYSPDNAQARWRSGYSSANRLGLRGGPDLDRATWARKRKAWRQPQHVVCPTEWLARCVRESALMSEWPVQVIPNPLDLNLFRPWPKALAREMLGLPAGVPLLAFGAMGGTRDPRKGWDLLSAALDIVGSSRTGAHAVIFGQSRPREEPSMPLPIHWIGHLADEITVALLYSAVDLVVVPSRQDNLPQTATEPQACGCPVVAFDTCGLSDAVEHGVTGLLAPPFDISALAANIITLLINPEENRRQSDAARERALRLWDADRLVAAYRTVYADAINFR